MQINAFCKGPAWKYLLSTTVRTMRILSVLLFATALHTSAHSLAQAITLSLKNAPLEKAFQAIQQQSGYYFIYSRQQMEQSKPISIDVKDVDLEQVLKECFKDQPLTYSIDDKHIVVKQKETLQGLAPPPPGELVRGTVTNEKGEPIAGATVILKGTKKGVATEKNGSFELKDVPLGSTLVISSVGYESQEQITHTSSFLSIRLIITVSGLDEVHIIGYGTTTRRLSTGSVSRIGAETIGQQPITNVLEAMSGRVPGLQIIQSNGMPGAPVTVQIRGRNSIAASNNPLYVVDGVPFVSNAVEVLGGPNGTAASLGSPLNTLNPSDIDNIEILKDADATAIYGSRAANGVILITTKKGSAGKVKLNININRGAGSITRFAQPLNTQQYIKERREALANNGLSPNFSNAPDIILWDTTKNTDWQKWYMGSMANRTDVTASLSGGNKQTIFLLSTNYHNEHNVLPGNTPYSRGNIHLSTGYHSENQKFQMTTSFIYTSDRNKMPGTIGAELAPILRSIPNYPVYDSLGKFNWTAGQTNFVSELQSYTKDQTDNLNLNTTLKYTILPELNIKTNIGYNKIAINQIIVRPSVSQNPASNPKGSSAFGNQAIKTYLFEPQAVYDKRIANGKLEILAGATVQKTLANSQLLYVNQYSSDLLLENPSFGTPYYSGGSNSAYAYVSGFARIGYNWLNKYVFNGSFRRDGSSRFGPGKQYGNFGSIGAAWLFSNEEFVKKKIGWLSYGKIRASFGTTGNDGIGDYGYLSTYASTTAYGSTNAIVPNQIANPDFQWEVNKKLEVASDLGFLKDRILLSISWYRNRSSNQLVGYALPSITGFSSYQANLGATVENKGWEFEVNTININNKNLQWTTAINLTIPKNILIDYPGLASSSYAGTYVTGQPLSIIQKYHFLGVDLQSGLSNIQDINKDGKYTPSSSYNGVGGDYIIAGNTAPGWYAGFSNTVKYKNFQLDIFFQYTRQQGYNLRASYITMGKMFNSWTNLLDYWKQAGDLKSLPKLTYNYDQTIINYSQSDAAITDASFLRLKNIAISYSLPLRLANQLKLSGLTLYLQGQNVLTLTRYIGYDPEMAGTSSLMVPPFKNAGSRH